MKYLSAILTALLLATVAMLAWEHHRAGVLGADLVKAQTTIAVDGFALSGAAISQREVTRYVDRVRVVHDTVVKIQREIPAYVPPTVDARFAVPVGFVRVHDSAATGVPLDAPGPADAASSGLAFSAVADTVAGNYGLCRETAEQLTALQTWVRQTEAAQPGNQP
jgi:hypothetical protein